MADYTYDEMLIRVHDKLERITDPILLILKGHLLVEEALTFIVEKSVANPQFIGKANLRFSQLLNIARALVNLDMPNAGPNMSAKIWDSVEALNALRNRLAHRLDPEDISQLLKRLFMGDDVPKALESRDTLYALYMELPFLVTVLMLARFPPDVRPPPSESQNGQ